MRSHYCGDLRASHDGETVELCGWVSRRRDHGGVIFLDLRDRNGLVQVVFDPDTVEAFALADKVRSEYVVRLSGRVRMRDEAVRNSKMSTGDIEVLGKELTILNEAQTPPFELDAHSAAGEEVRLKYRYMDLRRPEVLRNFQFRSRLTHVVRAFLEGEGFMDVETPILTRATPEGARDYLVPSRTHPGSFFALPQSPQLFKQLLMVAGFDRYYQIAKCFRDEDLRADRQPEFNLRGRFRADPQGRFHFLTVKPKGYALPSDGPVGQLMSTLGLGLERPAHIHFRVSAEGFETLTTHIFDKLDPAIGRDAIFGVKPELLAEFRALPLNGKKRKHALELDLVLCPQQPNETGISGKETPDGS